MNATDKLAQLEGLLREIPGLQNREDIFRLTWQVSVSVCDLTAAELTQLSLYNSLHVDVIFNAINNELFLKSMAAIMSSPFEDRIWETKEKLLQEKQIVQLFLRLSFFTVSIFLPYFRKETALFMRKQLSSSLNRAYKQLLEWGVDITMKKFLLAVDRLNCDFDYRFETSIPQVINTDFLNMNQIASRVIVGSLLLYRVEDWIIPSMVRDVVENNSSAIKLFRVASVVRKGIRNYQDYERLRDQFFTKDRKQTIIDFLLLLKDSNNDDLTFLIAEMGIDSRPEFREGSIMNKIEHATLIRERVQTRFETLGVFTGSNRVSSWSNKVFLNTVRFLSALESIRGASDHAWQQAVFTHFFNEWMNNLYENINYYRMKAGDLIAVYVEGLTDKIILEQAYRKLYPEQNTFVFYECGSKEEVFKKINAVQINDLGKTSFGIFDFDDAYNNFKGLRGTDGFGDIQGDDQSCLYRMRESNGNKVFAVLLPVPGIRRNVASSVFGGASMLPLELLFEDDLLQSSGHLQKKIIPGGSVQSFIGDKMHFAEETKNFGKEHFKNFQALFVKLHDLSSISVPDNISLKNREVSTAAVAP